MILCLFKTIKKEKHLWNKLIFCFSVATFIFEKMRAENLNNYEILNHFKMRFHFRNWTVIRKNSGHHKIIVSLYSWCSNPVKLSNGKSALCAIFYINIYADAIYYYFKE